MLGDCKVAHSGLYASRPVDGVHLQDSVELREAQQYPVGQRQGAAGQTRPGASRDHRYPQARTGTHHLLDLLDGFGEHRDEWDLTVRSEPVALVGSEGLLGMEYRRRGE